MVPLVRALAGGKAGTLDLPMENFPDVAAADYIRRFIKRRRDTDKPFCAFRSVRERYFEVLVRDAKRFEDRHVALMAPVIEEEALRRFRTGL